MLALAAGSLAISALNASAANSSYAAGDLVLFFQKFGGSNTVYADLGAATTYRGSATGPDVANSLNLVNLNSALTTAFGSWTSLTDLYMGVAGVKSASTSTAAVNGDPGRTIYVAQGRDTAGTVGSANSAGYTVVNSTSMTSGSNGIITMNSPFADSTGANGYNSAVIVSATSVSNIDDQNPFVNGVASPGQQDTAFGIFGGGVQQVGGTYSGSFGPVTNAKFVLDLYRIPAVTTTSGQVGQGETARVGTYEGSFALDNSGNVSFVTSAVPEPSSYAMLAIAGAFVGYFVIRRRKSSAV